MKRPALVRAVCLVIAAAVCVRSASAQRFEGVITMKLSGGNLMAAAGGRAGGEARGSTGRGGDGRAGEGRAGEGRAGEGRGAPGRGGDAVTGGRAGRATDAGRANDPQIETMRSALAGGLQQIEYMTRRGKVRIAVVGASGAPSPAAMIYVPDDGVMYTLLPPISMYSETSMADMQAGLTAAAPDAATRVPPRAPTVTHTKRFELIAGHRCEHVLIVLGQQKTDVCMGKGLGVFIMPAGVGRGEGWDRVLAEANGFPLKVVQGNGTVTMEVTKIERKALPEALFSVPDSYSKMPDIMRRPPG